MQEMKKPTFFISSTIFDFADLRSAIKYFLESQGCRVLASEYNDFQRPTNPHSYQACIEAISQADYFVLLIGSRVGGWVNEAEQLTITRLEYREAYKLHCSGRLKILSFVRSDIWVLREDRSTLKQYLEQCGLDEEGKKKIGFFPSKILSNPEYVIDFINEVGRIRETKDAIREGTPLPTANWIHQFSTFKDIIDVLQAQVFCGTPIEMVILKSLLRRELVEILREVLIKGRGKNLLSPKSTLTNFYREVKITTESRGYPTIDIPAKMWDILSTIGIFLLGRRLRTTVLQQALISGAFSQFNPNTGLIEETNAYQALLSLNQEIQLLKDGLEKEALAVTYTFTPRKRPQGIKSVPIDTMALFALLHLYMRWDNIIDLAKSLIAHLDGSEFRMPRVWKSSPIPEMNAELDKESISSDEVETFIKSE